MPTRFPSGSGASNDPGSSTAACSAPSMEPARRISASPITTVHIPHDEEEADGSLLRIADLSGVPPASVDGGWHPVGGEGFNVSLDDLVAAATAEATALVS